MVTLEGEIEASIEDLLHSDHNYWHIMINFDKVVAPSTTDNTRIVFRGNDGKLYGAKIQEAEYSHVRREGRHEIIRIRFSTNSVARYPQSLPDTPTIESWPESQWRIPVSIKELQQLPEKVIVQYNGQEIPASLKDIGKTIKGRREYRFTSERGDLSFFLESPSTTVTRNGDDVYVATNAPDSKTYDLLK